MRTLGIVAAIVFAIALNSCSKVAVKTKKTGPGDQQVYKITVVGISRDIRGNAMVRANGICEKQGMQFRFIKNVFLQKSVSGIEFISLDFYFTCLGDEAKSIPSAKDVERVEPVAFPEPAVKEEELPKQEHVEAGEAENVHYVQPILKPVAETNTRSTGNTPGELESLGDWPDDSTAKKNAPRERVEIVEEKLDK